MDVRLINPFVDSLIEALSMMASMDPVPQKPFIKESSTATHEITSLVSFANDTTAGTVALSLDKTCALDIYARFTGEELSEYSLEARDAVGEIVNMMAGGAKQKFSEEGNSFQISLPTVIEGEDSTVEHQNGCPVVVIPLAADDLNMCVEVAMVTE